jgi:hypothetical protein
MGVCCCYSQFHLKVEIGENGKYGIVDSEGQISIPFKYDYISGDLTALKRGVRIVRQYQIKYNAEMYGVIDAKDSILLPLEYTSLIYDRESGFYIMEKLDQLKDGTYNMDDIYVFNLLKQCGMFLVDRDGKLEIRVPAKYAEIRFSRCNYSVARKKDKYGVINIYNGEEIIPFKYDIIDDESCGLFCTKKKDKYGYLDRNGKIVIPFKFDVARPFYKGIAEIIMFDSGERHYIDMNGNILPFQNLEVVNLDNPRKRYYWDSHSGRPIIGEGWSIRDDNY